MVLAELPGRIAERLQHFGDRRILGAQADVRARQANLREAGADRRLAGDERGSSSSAALLPVPVGEHRAFATDAIDVGRVIAHQAVVIDARIEPSDVIPEDDEDVGLARLLRERRCSGRRCE